MLLRVVIGALLAGLGACIESGLVECADGRACPSGLRCDDVHHDCVSPDQLTACTGAADLTACQTDLIPDGVCFGGICLPAGCGNQEVEPSELCDDGNLVSGDGCAADCRSREVCGDGFADANDGEECDDGDHAGHDGCTAGCIAEGVSWRRQDYVAPVARYFTATVYDPVRRVLVIFGGRDDVLAELGDTWEWNGAHWREVTPRFSPPARYMAAAAYDPKRHRLVMFGGYSTAYGELDDTWEFDGATWQLLRPPIAPLPYFGGAMAWDPAIGKIVLQTSETWTWDGAQWTRIDTPQAPPLRTSASLVYDAAYDRLLFYGGLEGGTSVETDIWAFDGNTWTEVVTTGGPSSSVFRAALVYDPIHQVPLALTDHWDGSSIVLDVWELSGTSWRLLAGPGFGPNVLVDGSSWTFDIERRVIVEFGGANVSAMDNRVFEYRYDVEWVEAVFGPVPYQRHSAALAYDPIRGRVVMAGGYPASTIVTTQEWDGIRWSSSVQGPPNARQHHAMAFDGARVMLFGGREAAVLGDTWIWDGAWIPVAPATSPPPRFGHAMAHDSVRGRVVMFGGLEAGDVPRADTWEWDGATWQDVTPASSPPAMGGSGFGAPVMAYDSVRRRTVLLGGVSASETWEWDGMTWTRLTPETAPPLLEYPAMVYDGARKRVVVLGGDQGSFIQWEWDGTSWSRALNVSIVPDRLTHVAAAYDAARGEIVRFGGTDGALAGSISYVTWLGAYRGPDAEVCGSGHDVDRDGTIGCADEDCVAVCERCGDGACNGGENDRLCPADCPAPVPICGDAYCAPAESQATCAADCTP